MSGFNEPSASWGTNKIGIFKSLPCNNEISMFCSLMIFQGQPLDLVIFHHWTHTRAHTHTSRFSPISNVGLISSRLCQVNGTAMRKACSPVCHSHPHSFTFMLLGCWDSEVRSEWNGQMHHSELGVRFQCSLSNCCLSGQHGLQICPSVDRGKFRQGLLHGHATWAVAQGRMYRRACAWFDILLVPSWNSWSLWTNGLRFPFALSPANYVTLPHQSGYISCSTVSFIPSIFLFPILLFPLRSTSRTYQVWQPSCLTLGHSGPGASLMGTATLYKIPSGDEGRALPPLIPSLGQKWTTLSIHHNQSLYTMENSVDLFSNVHTLIICTSCCEILGEKNVCTWGLQVQGGRRSVDGTGRM